MKDSPKTRKKNLITFKSSLGNFRMSVAINNNMTGIRTIPKGAVKTPPNDASAVFSNGTNMHNK